MTPPKKAAKKAPKKAAKKSAMKMPHLPPEKGKDRKDLRRAYEHMGRIEALQASLGAESALLAIRGLGSLARTELESGHAGDAADLLRGAEHLSFAAMTGGIDQTGVVSADLEGAIRDHFAKLMERAAEHWQEENGKLGELNETYVLARQGATDAMEAGAFHQALEYARAAETLAQVKLHGAPPVIDDGSNKVKRPAAKLRSAK
jgi:hypothetical protein